MKRKSLIALLLTVTMLATTACGGSAEQTTAVAEDRNDVIMAFVSDVESLDPAHVYEIYTTLIYTGIYETLFYFADESEEAEPFLIDTYEFSEDGTVVTMTLKEGITFASGNPMTSEDVAFSIMRLKNMMGNPSSLAEHIIDVVAIDDLTFEIQMDQADSSLFAKLSYSSFTILDSEVVIANGGLSDENAAMDDTATAFLDENSAGSGPYILESYIPDVEFVLTVNENYWGETPEIERIVLKDIPDPNTQLMMLSSGDVDVAFNLNSDTIGQLARNEDVEILTGATKTMGFVFMNMDEEIGGPVSDPLVQQAVRYAIDYEGLKYVTGEGTVVPQSFIQIGFLGALEERDADYRDVEKAKELLAEAGYPDGFTIDFPVTDLVPEGISLTDIAQKIQADLAEVGITLNIETSTWAGGYGDQYRNGEIAFSVMYWSPDYNDPVVQLKFLPGKTVGDRVSWAEEAYPELEALYNEIVAETDTDKKVELLEEVQEMTAEFGPYIPISQFPTVICIDKDLSGVEYSNIYRTDLRNLSWN